MNGNAEKRWLIAGEEAVSIRPRESLIEIANRALRPRVAKTSGLELEIFLGFPRVFARKLGAQKRTRTSTP